VQQGTQQPDDADDEQCLCGWKLSTEDEKKLYDLEGSDSSSYLEDSYSFSQVEGKEEKGEKAAESEKSETGGAETSTDKGNKDDPPPNVNPKVDPKVDPFANKRKNRSLERKNDLDKLCHENNAIPMGARGLQKFLDAKEGTNNSENPVSSNPKAPKTVIAAANFRRGSQMGILKRFWLLLTAEGGVGWVL
jgi:hypothetical protein